jgi:hypothetical protein
MEVAWSLQTFAQDLSTVLCVNAGIQSQRRGQHSEPFLRDLDTAFRYCSPQFVEQLDIMENFMFLFSALLLVQLLRFRHFFVNIEFHERKKLSLNQVLIELLISSK